MNYDLIIHIEQENDEFKEITGLSIKMIRKDHEYYNINYPTEIEGLNNNLVKILKDLSLEKIIKISKQKNIKNR